MFLLPFLNKSKIMCCIIKLKVIKIQQKLFKNKKLKFARNLYFYKFFTLFSF